MEKLYKVQMNSKGMPNFSTAVEVADRLSAVDLSSVYSTAYRSGYEKGKADRPQGEWIEFDTKWGRSLYYCTNCMETSEVPTAFGKPLYDFCPNCGCRMKGADDE